jgi:DNA-binding response OmpR family regulator
MAKILLAEDDRELGATVEKYLCGQQGHTVEWAMDGEDAAEKLRVYQYDVLIVDWEMPKKTGLEVISEFRSRGGVTPVLFLTGRDAPRDKVAGLDSGADDYMTKPIVFEELAARVRALTRRRSGGTAVLSTDELSIDTASKCVKFNGELVHLAPREYALLEFLMRHRGTVFSNEALLNRVWDSDSEAGPDMVRATIKRIRKKLGIEGSDTVIRNVFGTGYVID